MRFLLVAFTGLMLLVTGSAAQANVSITVDKNAQLMTVAVDGVQRYQWPVSTGIPSRETPNGTFRAFRMEEDHFSKEFDDAPMPHSIFFTKVGHAIHGTESEGRLGTPVSHGCVRISRANATTLYALVQKEGVLNTTVTLTGSSRIALARNPGRATTDVATRGQTPQQYQAPQDQAQQDQSRQYQAPQYSAGPPVMLTPQGQTQYPPMQRADDGYIYPADGSSNAAIYPAPPGSRRRVYDAQSYPQPQQQYYDNRGYAPQPQPYYQQRGLFN
jgi:hypothetical protein